MLDYMPVQASDWAAEVDWVNNFITNIALFCTVAITGAAIFFAIRYRRKSDDQKTAYITHSNALETLWTAIPSVVVIFTFYFGFTVYRDMREPPPNAIEVSVQGYKWAWQFQYENGKRARGELVVPVNKPIRLVMRSKDVIHSMFIPAMRVKEDVLANRYSHLWFHPTKIGEYPIFCAEYCGTNHSAMTSVLKVVPEEQFQDYLLDRRDKELTPVELGGKLFDGLGCKTCHSLDGTPGVGPSLQGVFGRQVEFTDGSSAKSDENYLQESILNSQAKIVKGYQTGAMPAFEGQVNDDELTAIISYLKTLK